MSSGDPPDETGSRAKSKFDGQNAWVYLLHSGRRVADRDGRVARSTFLSHRLYSPLRRTNEDGARIVMDASGFFESDGNQFFFSVVEI